ncbi:MAG: phosphatase PAP2 family protein [Acidimicrobiales bacterium]
MSVIPTRQVAAPELTTGTPRARWWPEVLVIVWLCWVYDLLANLTPLQRVSPYAHARSILGIEKFLHLDPELALNHWLAGHPNLGYWLSNYYDNAHFVVTVGLVGWLWWRHPGLYRPLRSALVLINVISFVIFWLYPMAPPRLLPGAHFIDVVAVTHAFGSWHTGALATHADELAAMPSLHLAWAAWSAYAGWLILRRRRWAALVWLYPFFTAVVVLATANHFLIDTIAGAIVTALSVAAALRWYGWREARIVIRELRPRSGNPVSEKLGGEDLASEDLARLDPPA